MGFADGSEGKARLFIAKLRTVATSSVASNNSNLTDIRLFPNPTRATCFIQNIPYNKCDIVVQDLLGRVVYQRALTAISDHEIDCKGWAQGMYFVSVSSGAMAVRKTIQILY
jgi:hypothetical protein